MAKVKLLRCTPDPQRTIAVAARLCYAPVGAMELDEKLSDSEVESLVRRLISMGHMSAIEHASFTFAIEGISRACSHQLVRHRIASYNQQSQRYVQFEESPVFIVPPSIKGTKYEKIFNEGVKKAYDLYFELLSQNVEAEDARYILPNATETKIVVTMNARSLLHFLTLRCCSRAQWEIRELAMQMFDIVKDIAPAVFENAGPDCARTKCKEGKMSCGKPWKKAAVTT